MTEIQTGRSGQLALIYCGKRLPIKVLQSAAGFYIGTTDDEGPCSRESEEYFKNRNQAETALLHDSWTQRVEP